jgi:AcrR family transcriptional regulator
MKAPVGSVYHRFSSRDDLLAEIWLVVVESFQKGFLEALERDGLEAVLYTVEWVRGHFDEARLLLLYRREDLVSGPWPEHLKEKAARVVRELNEGVRRFTEKQFGSLTGENIRRSTFALTDVPLAALRPHLERGEPPPGIVGHLIRDAYLAIMRGVT